MSIRTRSPLEGTPILAIVGPTAAGKTHFAIEIAKQINGEVIGLDSRQVYAGMEIGTAQPSQEEQAQVLHHLVGVRLPHQAISAGEYVRLVEGVVEDIIQRKHQPILCGGAGLYYRALRRGIFIGSTTDLAIRAKLEKEYDTKGGETMLERLKALDPAYAGIVHPNNKKRLIRALEIFESTGAPPSIHFQQQQREQLESVINMFTVLITVEIKKLEARIGRRTDAMLAAGWVGEVERLRSTGSIDNVHPSDSIGYHQIKRHLEGGLTYKEMVQEINTKTRQYARKQLKWFQKEPINLIIDLTNVNDLSEAVGEVIDGFNSFLKGRNQL
ncbi:MAG: tRNA (adenosine(37)-N6)-dimethylallyltransferase MiaA [Fidelibacterota bacterium]